MGNGEWAIGERVTNYPLPITKSADVDFSLLTLEMRFPRRFLMNERETDLHPTWAKE